MGDFATLLRLVAASALVGLLAYCGAHVVQVWRKRNAKKGAPAAGPSATRRLAWVGLLVGAVLAGAAAVLREVNRTEGVLTGEDLFVVRAADDMAVEWLTDRDAVAAGEPLARFGSGSRSARAEELRARLARTEAERDVLALSPLTPDPELTRRHQGAAQERAQVQQELGQAVAAAEAADRDLATQIQAKKETLARLVRTLTEKRKDLQRATIRCAHARDLAQSYTDLRARGAVTAAEYQEQQKALRDADVEVTALAQEVKDGLAEKATLEAHLEKLEARRADPAGPLRAEVSTLRDRLTKLEAEETDLKARLDRDLARSKQLREAEAAQAEARVREQRAALAGLTGEQEVRAPFAGRVAYRAASPNATRSRGPLLVVGPENGFVLTARLARADAEAMRDGGPAVVEVGDDGPERCVPARFHRAMALANEPDQAALQLECQPPPGVVRRLAEGDKLTVAFGWKPPLAGMWPFRAGALVGLVGLIGLVLTRRPVRASRELVPWGGPGPRPGPSVGAFGPRREAVRDARAEPAMIEGTHPRRRAPDRPALEDDLPISAGALEEACTETLTDLDKAESTEEATRLLDRLHRLRRALREIDRVAAAEANGRSVAGAGS